MAASIWRASVSFRATGPRRLDKKHRGCSQQVFVVRGFGQGPIDRLCDGFQSRKRRSCGFLGRDGSLQQPSDLAYGHCRRVGIAGRATEPQQEAAVSGNALAHFAEAGEVDKKPLLEERRDRVVQIGRFGEQP